MQQIIGVRAKPPPPIRHLDRKEDQVPGLRQHHILHLLPHRLRPVVQAYQAILRSHPHTAGLPGRTDRLLGPFDTLLVGHHLQLARLIDHLIPTQAILPRTPDLAALGLAIDEELRLIPGSIDMDGRHLTFTARPSPVRHDMHHRQLRPPTGLIEPVTVLRETRQVDDAEIAAARREGHFTHFLAPRKDLLQILLLLLFRMEIAQHGQIPIVRRRFAQIVETGPDEFARALRHLVLIEPLVVRLGRPAGRIQIVRTDLEDRRSRRFPFGRRISVGGKHPASVLLVGHREHIIASRGDARSRLAAEERLPRMGITEIRISMWLIVQSVDIHRLGIGRRSCPEIVVARSRRPRGILPVTDRRQPVTDVPFVRIALLPHLVADGPEDDAGMVAVPPDQGDQILLHPFVEERGITVGLLGDSPGVRQLVHDEEAEPVAEVQQFRRGRIVGRADGIAAHLLELEQAPLPHRIVPGCAQSTRIVVQAHALQEHPLAVEIEAVRLPFGLAVPISDPVSLDGRPVLRLHADKDVVQMRRGRRPEIRPGQFFHDHLPVRHGRQGLLSEGYLEVI